jgi:hypothetical protein
VAGRPGSWEADAVRRIVEGSIPDDELHLYRTEPIQLLLNPRSVFEDLGLQDLFDDEHAELSQGYANGTEPDDDGASDSVIDAQLETLEKSYQADLDTYYDAYVESLKQIVSEQGFTVPVCVTRVDNSEIEPAWDFLAEHLHNLARVRTSLPPHHVINE